MEFKKGMPGKDYPVENRMEIDGLSFEPLKVNVAKNIDEWKKSNPQAFVDNGYPQPKPKTQAEIIWDLSTRLGEANHKLRMLEWKMAEMKKILED